MDFRFTPEEEAFRKEVGEFLDRELTPGACEKFNSYNWEPETREFLRRLGERGWLCP